MKKIPNFILLFVISTMTFAQKTNPPQTLGKEDYLQKSKNQKTAGWILRGGGAVLFSAGIIWGATSTDDVGPFSLCAAGGVCILTSIPLFMASRKNKKRAMEMAVGWQQSIQLQNNSLVKKPIPSLALKLNLFQRG